MSRALHAAAALAGGVVGLLVVLGLYAALAGPPPVEPAPAPGPAPTVAGVPA
ncbi:hypothetical protein [Promicromonospora sp. NPDC050880]|uniref:hypothetical protein n=1 Tax=Promicromonospora sp. NPDC050880 TaxID=3364406 RepID=UPI0037AEE119